MDRKYFWPILVCLIPCLAFGQTDPTPTATSTITATPTPSLTPPVTPTFIPTPRPINTSGLPNFGWVISKKLGRGAQPSMIGLHNLRRSSINIDVKLNQESEMPYWQEKAWFRGGKVINFPIDPNHPDCPAINKLVVLIHNKVKAGKRVFFHCTYGRDRAGLVAGLYRMRYQHWTYTQLGNDWAYYGTPMDTMILCLKLSITNNFYQ